VTQQFWLDLIERAGKTFVQGILAVLTVQGVSNALDVNWGTTLAVAGTAALVSVLTSLLSFTFGNTGTASATSAVVLDEPGDHAAPEA
jgi:hypothetical protein